MSFSDPISSSSALPVVAQTAVPEAVRRGGATAQHAYQVGLAFEQMLTNELAQSMSQTIGGTDGSSDGLGGSTDSGDGLGGSGSGGSLGSSPYASMIPQALTSGLMSGGGTGIAMQIAQGIDPSLVQAPVSGGRS